MRRRLALLVTAVLFVALGAGLGILAHNVAANRARIHAGLARNVQLEHQLAAQQRASVALAHQVRRLGHKPVVTPPVITGPSGPRGVQGLRGAKGATGQRGIAGIPGLRGLRGLRGLIGPRGLAGLTGAQGDKGDTGATGAAGANGENGAPGQQGPAGPQGDRGPQGEQGPPGQQGDRGPAGYPDSWTWTDMLGQTYTCTDPDGDHNYSCNRN